MDFRQIEAFVNVVKYKSFSKAADAIYLTQPTISSHINTLENELGTILIDRSGKDINTTKAGKLFYEYALNLINTRDQAIFKLNEYTNKLTGRLEIAASTVPSQYVLPQIMLDFTMKYKTITYLINQMDTKDVTDSILDRQVELGIIGSKTENDKLEYIHLNDDRLVLITPNNTKYSIIQNTKISIYDILDESFIMRESGSGTRQEFEKSLKKIGINPKSIKTIAQMTSTESIKQAVSLGLGISVVSSLSVYDYVKFGQIKAFEISELELQRAFYLIYHKSKPLSPLSTTFLDYIVNYYSK